MPPQQESLPVPRGRAQATKPLSGGSIQQPLASPPPVDEQPAGAAASGAAATTTHQEGEPGQVSDDVAEHGSQPFEATLTKERLNGSLPPTKETSILPPSANDEDVPPQPAELVSESANRTHTPQTQLELPTKSPVPLHESLPETASTLPKELSSTHEEEIQVQPAQPESTDYVLVSEPQPEPVTGFPIPPPEPLQITAQSYPWLYMGSRLEACFNDVETPPKKEHNEPETSVSEGDIPLEGGKARYEDEHRIEFSDELTLDSLIKEAPAVMQSFMTFSEVSERVEAEALQLAMNTPSLESEEPLNVYNTMMDKLSELLQQAEGIQSAIRRLTTTTAISEDEAAEDGTGGDHDTDGEQEEKRKLGQETDSARAQILGVFQACLPVLSARIANLSMAQELIDGAQENFSLALRMEDMGID